MTRRIPVFCTALLGLVACASAPPPEPHPALDASWGRFLQTARQRAFAIAGDPDGVWAGGIVGGYRSPIDAEREALALCERRRAAKGISTECRLYAVGSQIVWKPAAPAVSE